MKRRAGVVGEQSATIRDLKAMLAPYRHDVLSSEHVRRQREELDPSLIQPIAAV